MVESQYMKFPEPTNKQQRLLQIIAAVLTILILFILATSLKQFEFKGGEAQDRPEMKSEQVSSAALTFDPDPYIRGFFIIVIVLLAGGAVVLLTSKQERKRSLRNLGILMGYAIILLFFLGFYQPNQPREEAKLTAGPPAPVSDAGIPVTPVELIPQQPTSPPSLPPWTTYLISLAVVVAVGLAAFGVWKWMQPPPHPLRTIVEGALKDLASGREWEDTVIQCYQRMSTAVTQRRGIERHLNMTPREFVARLEQNGLPARPVENLTRLFERARYGSQHSQSREAIEAVDCLSAILQALENRS